MLFYHKYVDFSFCDWDERVVIENFDFVLADDGPVDRSSIRRFVLNRDAVRSLSDDKMNLWNGGENFARFL